MKIAVKMMHQIQILRSARFRASGVSSEAILAACNIEKVAEDNSDIHCTYHSAAEQELISLTVAYFWLAANRGPDVLCTIRSMQALLCVHALPSFSNGQHHKQDKKIARLVGHTTLPMVNACSAGQTKPRHNVTDRT